MKFYKPAIIALAIFAACEGIGQNSSKNLVYVDKQGVLRWSKDNKEAAFFGVNYTVPFAYGYRSHKALGIDPEKAISDDVYHLARLGIDAFRVHVWDTEITDSLGNLLENEHLRLYDFLLAELKKRGIKTFFTPLAYWGNGYPERDINTGSFSSKNNKTQVLVREPAIAAQENYLKQILRHVNPYTKLTYGEDPDVIGLEINNEPSHSGPKNKVTEYINRMVAAVKSTGWTKPVYYNISQSPSYADAVAKADIVGVSFQWYPTGLVANRSLKGNYLPHVDVYRIPFGDTIETYRDKSRMVYEFDAGDVVHSTMYPAMSRSFRTAGFQWATQFAYDPMATAYGNTEYQTHFLNLAYTPSKAISLLIAARVFHKVPRGKSYGSYPSNTQFDDFRLEYETDLSEMNSDEEFYYSNSTGSVPKNISKLRHIAGVGTSPVVTYHGNGAYFLDKIDGNTWRLELMPDAISIRDPFERASPKKEVTRIHWAHHKMNIQLPSLGDGFSIKGLNDGNNVTSNASGNEIIVSPGVFLLSRNNTQTATAKQVGVIEMSEFAAPKPFSNTPYVSHQPYLEVTENKSFVISAKTVGVDTSYRFSLELRHSASRWRTIVMTRTSPYDISAEVPIDMVIPGLINYRIIGRNSANEFVVFPGNHQEDPYAWDNYVNESWQTFIASGNSAMGLFSPLSDRTEVMLHNPDWRNNSVQYVTSGEPGALVMRTTMNKPATGQVMGWQFYFRDKIKGRETELNRFNTIVLVARTDNNAPVKAKISLITGNASAFSEFVTLDSSFKEIEIRLDLLKPDSFLLLPRPYPGFHPLWFKSSSPTAFKLQDAEKLEFSYGYELLSDQVGKPLSVEIKSIRLK